MSWRDFMQHKEVSSQDGTRIAYKVVGSGEKTLLLANGLGGRLYTWSPLIDYFCRDYKIITWDYRGLFESDSPARRNDLCIPFHVQDAMSILDAENVGPVILIGWSMGGLVSLELTARYPERFSGVVVINGIHGHALQTGFQPFFRVPLVPDALHSAIEWLLDNPESLNKVKLMARVTELPTMLIATITAGLKSRKLRPVIRQYFNDVLGESYENFLKLFQELDAHSVFHLLRDIHTPSLIIAGSLDVLAPSYQSKEMSQRMPNSEYLCIRRASHFCIIERPDAVNQAIDSFITHRVAW
ncbi:MAG: alpha/beta hydrolase [Myxococcota bacterium]|nr:alpha/beta hydrolase [Myxococcota bacterium]